MAEARTQAAHWAPEGSAAPGPSVVKWPGPDGGWLTGAWGGADEGWLCAAIGGAAAGEAVGVAVGVASGEWSEPASEVA